ncbi:hypothetical protein [Neisseria sp. Ec49-e6-T10]|uniref:bestrophin-like domain n=1 Tax=Neisseria sp. Ec49-e6-T10 TaxID=3140744 RepID=UPI003EB8FD08
MDYFDIYAALIFLGTIIILTALSLIGREMAKRNKVNKEDALLNLILNTVLSFLALLLGFCMSIAISGFDESQAAERNEALAIQSAYMYADLLGEKTPSAQNMIKEYLDLRIQYYKDGDSTINEHSQQQQMLLWQIVAEELNKHNPAPINSTLDAINHMMTTQKIAVSLWGNTVPILAWFIIYFLAGIACVILGCNIKIHRHILAYCIFPIILSTAFFIIQQIDSPGKSLVKVSTKDLINLAQEIK